MPSVALFRRGDKISQDYVVKKKIGEGQFSEVYEVEKLSNGTPVGILFSNSVIQRLRIHFVVPAFPRKAQLNPYH